MEAERAILHVPRVLAIPLSAWVERRAGPGGRARWLRRLLRWEALERLPTRRFTAHLVGVRARAV